MEVNEDLKKIIECEHIICLEKNNLLRQDSLFKVWIFDYKGEKIGIKTDCNLEDLSYQNSITWTLPKEFQTNPNIFCCKNTIYECLNMNKELQEEYSSPYLIWKYIYYNNEDNDQDDYLVKRRDFLRSYSYIDMIKESEAKALNFIRNYLKQIIQPE